MRVLIVDTCYPAFLASHYATHGELATTSYRTQWQALMDTGFGTADSYSHHLNALGHEAHELVVNCDPLQLTWAAEHKIRLPLRLHDRAHRSWRQQVVVAQAEDFAPDVVYVQNHRVLRPRTLRRLRALGAPIAVQITTEPPPAALLRQFDLVVTGCPQFVPAFRNKGVPAEYLRLAFDTRVLKRLASDGPPSIDYGAVFVGSLKRFRRWQSTHVIERAARRVPIRFWGYGASQWPRSSPIRRNFQGDAWGLDMFRVLRSASIALNRHADAAGGYACNMRLYEATGVGTLLLTDAKVNLNELFAVGTEVVAYSDADDLAKKISHYLQHEDERTAIARAGQARTLGEHTYAHRMQELAEILERSLGVAPIRVRRAVSSRRD